MNLQTIAGSVVLITWIALLWRYTSGYRIRRYLLPALILKIAAGSFLGYLYYSYYGQGDTLLYFRDAVRISEFALTDPGGYLNFLFQDEIPGSLAGQLYFDSTSPRAFFFTKVVSVFNLFAGNQYFFLAACFSLFSFTCLFLLAEWLAEQSADFELPAVISLLFLPSVVLWSSGVVKESLALGSLALCIYALGLLVTRKEHKSKLVPTLLLIVSFLLLWKVKYYYAAVFAPFAGAWVFSRWVADRQKEIPGWQKLAAWCGILLLAVVTASLTKEQLGLGQLPELITRNYEAYAGSSAPGSYIFFPWLDGTWWGILLSVPRALFSGIFRPSLFDIHHVWSAFLAIENIALLALFLYSLREQVRLWQTHPLIFLSAWGYTITLAVFLSMSAPNFGTLARFRVGWLIVFSFLILHRNPMLHLIRSKIQRYRNG